MRAIIFRSFIHCCIWCSPKALKHSQRHPHFPLMRLARCFGLHWPVKAGVTTQVMRPLAGLRRRRGMRPFFVGPGLGTAVFNLSFSSSLKAVTLVSSGILQMHLWFLRILLKKVIKIGHWHQSCASMCEQLYSQVRLQISLTDSNPRPHLSPRCAAAGGWSCACAQLVGSQVSSQRNGDKTLCRAQSESRSSLCEMAGHWISSEDRDSDIEIIWVFTVYIRCAFMEIM